ncbi:MAG: hypothetical protein NWF09_07795, partial [Candidatus Bathyarchaeota archaeon]|nr:hypothetical protein [Candidatus Bathyarchaeota archaeon]
YARLQITLFFYIQTWGKNPFLGKNLGKNIGFGGKTADVLGEKRFWGKKLGENPLLGGKTGGKTLFEGKTLGEKANGWGENVMRRKWIASSSRKTGLPVPIAA